MTNTTIIANGTVLTCDAAHRCGAYHLVLANGRILDLSENLDKLKRDHPDAQIVDASGKLLLPGFVNAHFHGESFLLHPLTRGLHMALWKDNAPLRQTTERLMHVSSRKDIGVLYRAAYAAHARCGTTSVGEFPMPWDEESFKQVVTEGGESRAHLVVTLQNWDHIRTAKALAGKCPRVALNLGKESDLTVYSIENVLRAAKDLKAPILAHIAEQREDADIMLKNFQKGIINLLHGFNALRPETILIHANHITEDEAVKVKDADGTVVVCPRSTAAKQTGYPALRSLAKHRVRLALGTDWGNVDMLEEMRFVYQLPLVVPGLRMLSPLEVVHMATINGAAALGLHKETGSLETGKRADIVFFSLNAIRLPLLRKQSPAEEVAQLVVEALTAGDISDVMVAGEFVVHEQKLTRVAEPELIQEWRALCSRFYPEQAALQSVTPPAAPPSNVIPFMQDVRTAQEEPAGGFESGFAPQPPPTVTTRTEAPPPHPLANRPKVQREPVKPELPKDTRRVFGDDEDFDI
jgi:5-methylthioadenosine/S-adenosylhomocysteine deaminase